MPRKPLPLASTPQTPCREKNGHAHIALSSTRSRTPKSAPCAATRVQRLPKSEGAATFAIQKRTGTSIFRDRFAFASPRLTSFSKLSASTFCSPPLSEKMADAFLADAITRMDHLCERWFPVHQKLAPSAPAPVSAPVTAPTGRGRSVPLQSSFC